MRITEISMLLARRRAFSLFLTLSGALALSGCGNSVPNPVANAATDSKASVAAAQRSLATDAANASARAASQEQGKAEAARRNAEAQGAQAPR